MMKEYLLRKIFESKN